jgi:type I restriction enzyme S subunit
MMKAAQLRQAILQAAVQGKLVPQNSHDEPASALLERIRAEKTKLVKTGKLKKEKPLSSIAEDEIPYDLPKGWEWYQFGQIATIAGTGLVRSTAEQRKSIGYRYFKMNNIENHSGKFTLSNMPLVEATEEEVAKYSLANGDFLFNTRNSYELVGKTTVIKGIAGDPILYNNNILKIRFLGNIYPEYINYFFISDSGQGILRNLVTQTTNVAAIYQNQLVNIICPIPPVSEQQRIVDKLSGLMSVCDELAAAEKASNALDENFIEYLPKSILQAAVQGKLVPQNPSDEPASALLERIRSEKAKLVKAGKLKKDKPLSPITEEEMPYDLPDGWEWCRLGEIHSIHRGITFPASVKGDAHTKGVVCCATTGSVQETYNPKADVYVPEKYVKNQSQWLLSNDIIMSTANSRELVGKTCFWNGKEQKTFGGFLTVIRACNGISVKYSYYVLQYLWKTGAFVSTSTQTTNIANINNSVLANTIIPVPPIAEQKRMVTKVDELMALCAKLKTVTENVELSETKQAIVVPLGKPQENEPLRMAARGKVNKTLSEAHKKAREDVFSDD